ncbi:peroxiredoxin [Shewanella indica]|uniref:Thioredoxin peroxidase n=1 Tax=Shewanella indica TaxID=768528 RepID=A0ABU4QG34_9GAMM|nr:peroxiredoxin [Shewanella indica]MDX6017450.1 peroxiredoxin [Shewanella indica]
MTEQTTVVAMPGLNEAAPPFTAKTTQGTLSLEDSKGKWLVLFSDPADFTPVCTTEFMAFTQASADFTALNCEPMGLSIEGIHAHIAWARSIKDNLGVEINFPIIADLNIKIAGAYGMVQPGASNTSAVRATFVIDPEGVLRAMLYYPMSNGRSVAEILGLAEALQTSDANVCATPESWIPGNEVIVPPPAITQEAEVLKVQGYN